MLYAILVVLLVAVDQVVKFLIRANIPLGQTRPFIPHVMELTYVQNTGAAFSILRDHTWILTIISLVVTIGVIVAMVRRTVSHPFGMFSLSIVLAGAVGNLIDRMFMGYVTDMFQTIFINFAVFNVADICVVLGGIAFCVYLLYFYDKLEKKEPEHDAADTDR